MIRIIYTILSYRVIWSWLIQIPKIVFDCVLKGQFTILLICKFVQNVVFLWNNFSKYFCCYSNCITVCGFSPTVLTCMSVPMSPTRQDCGGEGGFKSYLRLRYVICGWPLSCLLNMGLEPSIEPLALRQISEQVRFRFQWFFIWSFHLYTKAKL